MKTFGIINWDVGRSVGAGVCTYFGGEVGGGSGWLGLYFDRVVGSEVVIGVGGGVGSGAGFNRDSVD